MAAAAGFCLADTAIGCCGLAWTADGAIAGAQLPEEGGEAATRRRMQARFPAAREQPPPSAVQAILVRLQAALRGEPQDLRDVPLDWSAVPAFAQQVYAQALAIPAGQVLTYGELATRLGQPGAARAVGQALGANPFAPLVPCHRVLAAGGRPGGFSAAGGARTKLRLLEIERAVLGPQGPGLFG